jgi:hypothetical protein
MPYRLATRTKREGQEKGKGRDSIGKDIKQEGREWEADLGTRGKTERERIAIF